MKNRFKAVLITKDGTAQKVETVQFDRADLMEGDVTVAVSHSTVNYKDGLAITGRSPVVRKFPMIPGIDLAGTVETSASPNFKPGDKVLLNGFGLSETHFGGYAEIARVKSDWLVPLPKAFTAAEAMAIGTAGYTAMLSVLALEDAGLTPAKGPIVVTGASGGVGSVAIAILTKLGYRVIASTGRTEEEAYLKELGSRGDHSARRAWRRAAGDGQGALGGRHRQRGFENPCQCDRLHAIRRRGGGLRPGAGARSARQRGAIHPAGRFVVGDRICAYADATTFEGVGTLGATWMWRSWQE